MNGMESFIVPIKKWEFGVDTGEKREEKVAGEGFRSAFRGVFDAVKTSQKDVEEKQYLLATGQLDNLHELPIAEAKASLSVD